MSKQQCRQSAADPLTAISKITDLFQQNTVETDDGLVELVCRADPGDSEVELQDCELLSPVVTYMGECGDEQAVTLVTSPLSRDVTLIT